jgi:hypothetical protein
MDTRVAERIEGIASVAAAAILAAAVAYALSRVATSAVTVAAAAAAALLVALQILRSIGPNEGELSLAAFEPAELVIEEQDELILTETDRVDQAQSYDRDNVLVLDDILTELGDGSRVVRLFDASAMPTPGQLKARIDRHLDHAHSQNASADASEALHDALATLRRSLR